MVEKKVDKELDWNKLVEERKNMLIQSRELISDKVVEGQEIKKLTRQRKRARKSFRRYIGKEIVIKRIYFDGEKAIVTFEVDGQEETAETADKFLIRGWLIDYKVAIDLGAKGVKVKVKERGKYGIVFE